VPGFSGDGGAATNAELNTPVRLSSDSAGNLYIADYLNKRIRRVDTLHNQTVTTADVENQQRLELAGIRKLLPHIV
jgi:hypothetical protein